VFYKTATLAGVAVCLSLPVVAQQTTQPLPPSSTSATQGQPTTGMNASSIRQHIEEAGYTNVKIVPASFVAQAKNKQGHPVTMLITPDAITTITDESVSSTSGGNGPTPGSSANQSTTSTPNKAKKSDTN
jgi:hypothetical protein